MRKIGLVSWALAAALPALAAAASTSGFITTRPTCVPPKYTADPLNYLQAPEPILRASGEVDVLVGTGRCCNGRHWEAIYSLAYPAEAKAAVPRFHPLWATDDFNRLPKRKEAEIGFPSAFFLDGRWHLAMTTSFVPYHKPDRDRIGRVDLPDLVTRATINQVVNNWVPPIDPRCRGIASCSGDGSGLDLVLTVHPSGDLYLYHRDGNYPACPSGYVRHKVAADLSVDVAVAGCVQFAGRDQAPRMISDIARRADGSLSMLLASPTSLQAIEEWTSTGSADTIGLFWTPSGRTWIAPEHSQGWPWSYYVRDAGFLKDETRTVVEPTVVVSQISDGISYQDMANAQLGRWYLYYWADDGAALPPTFGGAADACAYQGTVEAADCTTARGWAWDPKFPDSPITVDMLVDGKVVDTIAADVYRADLEASGRGDGRHGFTWTIPAAFHDGKKHKVSARFDESVDALVGKVAPIACQ